METLKTQIHSDTHYDPNTSFVDISVTKQADLDFLEIKPDNSQWGHIGDDQTLEPPSDDEEDGAMIPTTHKHIDQQNPKKAKLPNANTTEVPAASKAKLRPASDILSRLRWDPSLSREPYTIGYLDRFAGVKEIPQEAWRGEITDEEFVPGHRILWFRRVSDGVLVWEREGRVDLIFGSGNGNGRRGTEAVEGRV